MTSPDKPKLHRDACAIAQGPDASGEQAHVGYKNPPKHTQFKGSGNPGGRPKKKPPVDFDELILGFLESKPAQDRSWLELIITGITKEAAKGDVKASKYLCELYLGAAGRRSHRTSDTKADREAAERLLASLTQGAAQILSLNAATNSEDPAFDDRSDD